MNSKNLTKALCIIYLLALTWIIVCKMQFSFANPGHIRSVNLIPFKESVIVNGKLYVNEIIYNILAFIPLGVFSAILLSDKSLLIKIAPAFVTSLLYETLQFVFAIGTSDITDLLGNTLGGAIGVAIFFAMSKIWKDRVCKVVNVISLVAAIVLICLIVLLMMF